LVPWYARISPGPRRKSCTRTAKDDLTLFDRATSDRLDVLREVARTRMVNGETDITLDFTTGA
jgi:hypothetical protein